MRKVYSLHFIVGFYLIDRHHATFKITNFNYIYDLKNIVIDLE